MVVELHVGPLGEDCVVKPTELLGHIVSKMVGDLGLGNGNLELRSRTTE